MARKMIKRVAAGCAVFWLAAGWTVPAPAKEPAPPALRQAMVCPSFKGDPVLASIYHDEMVKMLKAIPGIEFLEGRRALAQHAPEFIFRVNGSIVTNEDGQLFVVVALEDGARKEQIASHIAPASTNAAAIAAWNRTIQADMARRASRLPFECRIRRQQGQESVTLDRGLDSGLQPGMLLYVSVDEEPLLSPITGEVIGRDAPRAVGQVEVFRVKKNTAYARPVGETKLPRVSRLFARSF